MAVNRGGVGRGKRDGIPGIASVVGRARSDDLTERVLGHTRTIST